MKLLSLSAAYLLSLAIAAYACPDGELHAHTHRHERRAALSASVTPPSRPLQWGDLNFLHTTDTHGWLLGHQKTSAPEPNYGADWGDYASFVEHMKKIAEERDVDLLLVDSGDLHDGTGLVDGFPAGGVDGHDANQYFAKLPYDILAIGNHELYVYNVALDMHNNFAPRYPGRYLTSNVNITLPGATTSVPLASRFSKFKTRKGRKVTAFGVLYKFTGAAKGIIVQKPGDMVKEQWFLDAIKEEPDFFLLVGHMPVQKDDWPLVFNAIRAVHATTPIFIFGGHLHIRDCVQLDGRSVSLASGRYMETLGWLSADLDKNNRRGSDDNPHQPANITFSRRYLDPNRVTYEYHSHVRDEKFDTMEGKTIKQGLMDLAEQFNINSVFGAAPQDFTLSRSPYPSDDSVLSLFIEKAAPTALKLNNTRSSIPSIFIANSGGLRFDLFAGPFTRNDQFVVSPFTNSWLYLPGITAGVGKQFLTALKGAGAARGLEDGEVYEARYREWLEEMDKRSGLERRAAGNLTLGYVTQDSCPGVGDDILHAPLPFYSSPNYITSTVPNVSDDTMIDIVFLDFISPQILNVINSVQTTKVYTTADLSKYSTLLSSEVLGVYAQTTWK